MSMQEWAGLICLVMFLFPIMTYFAVKLGAYAYRKANSQFEEEL